MEQVLYLDAAGMPQSWMRLEEAARLYAKDQVLWELGTFTTVLRGGTRRCGTRSELAVASVIAGRGIQGRSFRKTPTLTNANLFARDQYLCLYCGDKFPARALTRDHIIPTSRGGANSWENTCAACRRCNNVKAARTPEEAKMELLALPFTPNRFEALLLQGRNIIVDQMEYLRAGLSDNRNWLAS
ncbi:HNH endonuclease [Microbulbifer sp. TYP-18]|uniref:HNH endonuclease n=1 Tax=Microbulbifer sp. TYP-18 TaxID=3230024 RepID=UPI0034C6902B